ncbi:MAG: tetratricopeptide repeat protein [Tannerellaceae bacterium]|nr:tetratricopeptide repeat protein [Tannerellaceae bacterium]
MMKQKKSYYWIIAVLLLGITGSLPAQKAERKNVRSGNKLYQNELYTDAEIAYRKGLEVNPTSFEGTFNLGNALYRQEKYKEAAEQYERIAQQGQRLLNDDPDNAEKLAQVFHNLGNIGMKEQRYAESIELYKQALRLNPADDETRYNLALAQKLLEDQEGEGGNDDNDQNEDEQDQDQNQEQQQPEDQDENQSQQEEQEQNDQMSRDNAQQILDAFLEDEKDTQEKVQRAQQQQQERRRTDKEW